MTDTETCGAIKNDGEPCEYRAKYGDGRCGIHSEETGDTQGRPSQLEKYKDDILDAAEQGLTYEGIARVAGVGVSTLHDWRDRYESFSESLKRARSKGERELIDDVDAEFVLERSYGYTKTEQHDVDLDADVDGTHNVTSDFVTYETDDE